MTYEEQYQKETGETATYTMPDKPGVTWHTLKYIRWLENKLDAEHRRRVAAEAFIAARVEMCKKNHLCDAIELQRDFETFTAWQAIIKSGASNE